MSPRLRALIGAIALAAMVAMALLLPMRELLTNFLGWSASLGGWAPVVLGATYLPASVLMIPGSVLTLGTGFVAGLPLGFAAVSLGSTLGATVAFLLGRTVARPLVEARVAGYPRFAAVQEAVGKSGFKIVFLLRLSPIFPFALLNYALGVTRVRLRDYVLASWLGIIPGTLMYVYLGSAAKSLAEVAAGSDLPAGGESAFATRALFGLGLLATVVVTVVVTRIARRALADAVGPEDTTAAELHSEGVLAAGPASPSASGSGAKSA